MAITYGDYLIDSGYYDITPEQEREIEAREECARRGIGPDEICADGGVTAWMVVDQELRSRRRSPEHCQTCGRTDKEYEHTGKDCRDPWHERAVAISLAKEKP
jgi:hypothetical protein